MVARDPSASEPGPSALLVDERALREFLDRSGYEIVWAVHGCKVIIGEQPAMPNELRLIGSFRYRDGNVEGAVNATYCTFPARNE